MSFFALVLLELPPFLFRRCNFPCLFRLLHWVRLQDTIHACRQHSFGFLNPEISIADAPKHAGFDVSRWQGDLHARTSNCPLVIFTSFRDLAAWWEWSAGFFVGSLMNLPDDVVTGLSASVMHVIVYL